jgi:hypothetical protein
MHNYKPKLVCIARCKNEMHIIKNWYESLPFVDLFCITDNNSTDGTYEYLKSKDNILVTRVEGFDEGRDFQILLKMAKAHEPEWILKMDCDEFFEEEAIKNMDKILNQNKFDTIFFRLYDFDFRLKKDEYKLPKNTTQKKRLYLTRNSKYINISDVKIHTGSFRFYIKPTLSNFRIKHYPQPSSDKANEKAKNYNYIKTGNNYNINIQNKNIHQTHNIYKFEENEKNNKNYLKTFGLPVLFIEKNRIEILKPRFDEKYIKNLIKINIINIINYLNLNRIVLFVLNKKRKKRFLDWYNKMLGK